MLTAISVWVSVYLVGLAVSCPCVCRVRRVLVSVATLLEAVHLLAPILRSRDCAARVYPPVSFDQCERHAGPYSQAVHLS